MYFGNQRTSYCDSITIVELYGVIGGCCYEDLFTFGRLNFVNSVCHTVKLLTSGILLLVYCNSDTGDIGYMIRGDTVCGFNCWAEQKQCLVL